MIEPRPYGADCTAEEREALLQRVRFLADDIVLYEEVPVQSPFQIELMFGKVREITADLDGFFYVIDLSEAERPSAKVRLLLKEQFQALKDRIIHTSVHTGKNFIINVAVRFVFNGFGFRSYTIHRTREQAITQIERVRSTL